MTTGCYILLINNRAQPVWLFSADTNYLHLQENESLCYKFQTTADGMKHNTLYSSIVLKYNFQELYFLLYASSTLHSFDTFSY